jgi:hypothetical protein
VTPICFVDTETTGVHPGRRAWEIAIIRREPNDAETTLHVFVSDVDLSAADTFGLKVGRFYDRHPNYNGTFKVDFVDDPWCGYTTGPIPAGAQVASEAVCAELVERITRGAHLVGAVPNFDAEVFADMLRRHQLTPAWHYHLIDVEALAVGYLAGLVAHTREEIGQPVSMHPATALPWRSDDLSRACGVEPPGDDERHTALGDARWAMRWYDAITGTAATR